MPSKSQRAASRQAQIRKKKRRTKGPVQQFIPGPITRDRPSDVERSSAKNDRPLESDSTPLLATPQANSKPARPSLQRTSTTPSSNHTYLGSELKRIGIITTLIIVILSVLTVILR